MIHQMLVESAKQLAFLTSSETCVPLSVFGDCDGNQTFLRWPNGREGRRSCDPHLLSFCPLYQRFLSLLPYEAVVAADRFPGPRRQLI